MCQIWCDVRVWVSSLGSKSLLQEAIEATEELCGHV